MTQGARSPAAPKTAGTTQPKPEGPSGIPDKPGWYVLGAKAPPGRELPRSAITFGGQTFPEFAYDENPVVTPSTIEYNQRRRGQRIWLDEVDLENMRAAVGKKIVRVRSLKSGSCTIIKSDSRGGRRKLKGDLPLERFLYIEPATDPEEEKAAEDDIQVKPLG